MQDLDVVIREAVPADGAALQHLLRTLNQETPYLLVSKTSLDMPVPLLAQELEEIGRTPNRLVLVGTAGDRLIGLATVTGADDESVQHIGEVGISVLKEFWGLGLGSILLEEVIDWARHSGIIRRLELSVQERNERAVRLYRKLGFTTECVIPRGMQTADGRFLNVAFMSLLID